MTAIYVESNSIKSIEYNKEFSRLTVEFHSSGKYTYSNVPQDVYFAFISDRSKGRFFANNIKGKYDLYLGDVFNIPEIPRPFDGNIVILDGCAYIVARCTVQEFVLININTGTRYDEPTEHRDWNNLTHFNTNKITEIYSCLKTYLDNHPSYTKYSN